MGPRPLAGLMSPPSPTTTPYRVPHRLHKNSSYFIRGCSGILEASENAEVWRKDSRREGGN